MERPDDRVEPGLYEPLDVSIPLARPIGPVSEPQSQTPPDASKAILLPSLTASDALRDLLLFAIVFVALMLLGEVVIVFLYDALSGATYADDEAREKALRKAVLVPAICWRVFISTLIAFLLVRWRGISLGSLGLTFRKLGINLLVGLGTYGVIVFGTIFFSILIQRFFPGLDQEFQENAGLIRDVLPRLSPWGFALLSLAIGYYEELVFRGVLMPRLRRATGSWVLAVVLTTLIFSVLHLADQAAAALLAICTLSLIFSAITVWRRSLVPAIVAHALFDWGMFLLLYYNSGDRWK